MGAALSRDNNVIANLAVSGDAGLTSNDDVLAYDGRTRQADLSAQQGMLANSGSVAYLRKIIDLYASRNARLAYARSVDAGVGLHFYVALEYGWP
jgi:hypothetical protein